MLLHPDLSHNLFSSYFIIYSDVAGIPVSVCEYDNGPLLGAAVLAAVGVGIFDEERTFSKEHSSKNDDFHTVDMNDVVMKGEEGTNKSQNNGNNNSKNAIDDDKCEEKETAVTNADLESSLSFKNLLQQRVQRGVNAMVRTANLLTPDLEKHKQYGEIFLIYEKATEAIRECSHDLARQSYSSSHPSSSPPSSSPPSSSPPSSSPSLSPTLSPFSSPFSSPSSFPSVYPTSSPSSSPSLTASAPSLHEKEVVQGTEIETKDPSEEAVVQIIPSILSADFGCLAEEAMSVYQAGKNTGF